MRYPGAFALALVIGLALFWLMQWLVAPPEDHGDPRSRKPSIQVMSLDQPPEPQPEDAAGGGGSSAPPEPPPVPGLERPGGIPIPAPKADSNVLMPELDMETDLSSKAGMGESFAGFGSGGSGGGSGGGEGSGFGRGSGRGAGGPDLVPLSTARPQIPESACRRGIEGWALAEFNITPRGRVTNVRVLDAQPRGLFEEAMVKSLENWLYEATDGETYQVTFRFEFKLDDCKLNWD